MAASGSASQSVIRAVKRAASLVELAQTATRLRRVRDDRWVGLCPLHHDTHPSFQIAARDGTEFFYCFGCQAHGDVFDFLRLARGLSFGEALAYLADLTGIRVEDDAWPDDEGKTLRMAMAALRAAQQCFVEERIRAVAELRRRGLDEAMLVPYGVGYADDGRWWGRLRMDVGIEAMRAAGLVTEDGGPLFRRRLTFPLYDTAGALVGFSARALDGAEPKYLSSRSTRLHARRVAWFGLTAATRKAIRDKHVVYIVEGPFDVLALAEIGYPNTVAVCGTEITDAHAAACVRWGARPVLVLDGDAAGRRAAVRLFPRLAGAGAWPGYVAVPDGTDPADCMGDPAARDRLREALAAERPLLRPWLDHLSDQPESARTAALRDVLGRIDDPVLREQCAATAARVLGVPTHALLAIRPVVSSECDPFVSLDPARMPSADAALVAVAEQTDAHDAAIGMLRWLVVEPWSDVLARMIALPLADRATCVAELPEAQRAVVHRFLAELDPNALFMRTKDLVLGRQVMRDIETAMNHAASMSPEGMTAIYHALGQRLALAIQNGKDKGRKA